METPTRRQIGFGDWKCPPKLSKYLKDILKSGRLTYGDFSKKLEEQFASLNGTKYVNFCSSGTAALFVALATLRNLNPERAKKKKYIIMPATNFVAGFNCTIFNGFQPVFCDIDNSYNISLSSLESKLKEFGRDAFAVMPVSLMGYPVNGLAIRELVDSYTSKEAYIVLDSCENICSKYDEQYPESYADFTAWSGYISHLLVVGACGGFLGTNNEKLAIRARSVINHGRMSDYISIDDDNNVNEAKLHDIIAKRFKFFQHGLNFRLGEVEAAFGLAMLEDRFPEQLKARKANGEWLYDKLKQFPLKLRPGNSKADIKWMMCPIETVDVDKWKLINFLEDRGIETREILPMYHPITEPYLGDKIKFASDYPVSARVLDKGFYIGCHQYLAEEDLQYIIDSFKEFFDKKHA